MRHRFFFCNSHALLGELRGYCTKTKQEWPDSGSKDFCRKGDSVKRSRRFSEPPDSEKWKVAALIPFPKIISYILYCQHLGVDGTFNSYLSLETPLLSSRRLRLAKVAGVSCGHPTQPWRHVTLRGTRGSPICGSAGRGLFRKGISSSFAPDITRTTETTRWRFESNPLFDTTNS